VTDDALGLAFAYLNRRERTAAEVRARLARAGCGPAQIEEAIDELRALGQVDDARFARLFAQDRRELDGWGHERIANRLRELGVERELIAETLADEPAAEMQRAVELLERRFGRKTDGADDAGGAVGDVRVAERAFGVLVRKGYERDLAADAVRRWRGQRDDCIG
jgi:regulatory protein